MSEIIAINVRIENSPFEEDNPDPERGIMPVAAEGAYGQNKVDFGPGQADSEGMYPSVEEMVENYRKASEAHRREIDGDPAKARAWLERVMPPADLEAEFSRSRKPVDPVADRPTVEGL